MNLELYGLKLLTQRTHIHIFLYRLQPFIGVFLTGEQFLRPLSPFLIESPSADTDQDLTASVFCMMDMPLGDFAPKLAQLNDASAEYFIGRSFLAPISSKEQFLILLVSCRILTQVPPFLCAFFWKTVPFSASISSSSQE